MDMETRNLLTVRLSPDFERNYFRIMFWKDIVFQKIFLKISSVLTFIMIAPFSFVFLKRHDISKVSGMINFAIFFIANKRND